MASNSITAVGPVLAAEIGYFGRNEAARSREEPKTVTVEVVRPIDPETKIKADSDVMQSVPRTDRLRIDISV